MPLGTVNLKLVAAGKLLVTLWARVRLLPGVDADVAVAIGLLGEGLGAIHARVAEVVTETVGLKVVEGHELGVTEGTGVLGERGADRREGIGRVVVVVVWGGEPGGG